MLCRFLLSLYAFFVRNVKMKEAEDELFVQILNIIIEVQKTLAKN